MISVMPKLHLSPKVKINSNSYSWRAEVLDTESPVGSQPFLLLFMLNNWKLKAALKQAHNLCEAKTTFELQSLSEQQQQQFESRCVRDRICCRLSAVGSRPFLLLFMLNSWNLKAALKQAHRSLHQRR